jgi:hypothetical protein
MGYTRLDRDSNVVRHDSRLEHAWCRYNKSNSLRGKREEGVRNIIIRALGIHFLGADLEFEKFKNQPYGSTRIVCGRIPPNI